MGMSDEHKEALARGRREARALKEYLEAIGGRRPGRPVTVDSVKKRIEDLKRRISAEQNRLRVVELHQQLIDAQVALTKASSVVDLTALERAFIAHAASYSQRKGISYAAWREAGVPASVLKDAGISR